MSASDFSLMVGLGVACFAGGWASGYLFKAVRRVVESVFGASG